MYRQWAAAGVHEVCVKLGGANNGIYESSTWRLQADRAREAGLKVSHYWFNGRDTSLDAQAVFIAARVPAGEVLWWDVEGEGSVPAWSPDEVHQAALALAAVGIPLSRQGVYMSASLTRSRDWSTVVDLKCWVASYGQNVGHPTSRPLVGYWPECDRWQYTSVGRLPGYLGDLDLNRTGEPVWTVHALQTALNLTQGAGLVVDGVYGRATSGAVAAYQRSRELAADGDAGTLTLTALEADTHGPARPGERRD